MVFKYRGRVSGAAAREADFRFADRTATHLAKLAKTQPATAGSMNKPSNREV